MTTDKEDRQQIEAVVIIAVSKLGYPDALVHAVAHGAGKAHKKYLKMIRASIDYEPMAKAFHE